MAGLLSAVSAVEKMIQLLKTGETTFNSSDIDLFKANGSLTKLLSKYVVEPVIICSKGTKQSVVFDKLLQLHIDIFSSFYFQVFKILTNVNGLDANFVFDIMSSDNNVVLDYTSTRTLTGGLSTVLGFESHDARSINELFSTNKFIKISSETTIDDKDTNANKISKVKNDDNDIMAKGLLQKEFNVDIHFKLDGTGKTIQVPITVKAHVVVTDTQSILAMLAPNSKEKSYWYRLNQFLAGEITAKELIFCDDIISDYKHNRLKDTEGNIGLIESRKNRSVQRSIMSGKAAGFERNYNMLIITSDDKPYFDKHIGGDITIEKNKQKLLSEAYSLTVTIVDEDYERVNVYTRDIRGNSDIGFKALSKRKNDSNDIGELIKSLLMSKPMSF